MLLEYIKSLYRFNFWSKEKIQIYQKKKIAEVINIAVTNTTFYKRYYSGYDLNNFANLPFTNKKLLIENFTDANTVGLVKEEVFSFQEDVERTRDFTKRLNGINIGMSSGTSGNRGVEVVPPDEEDLLRGIFFSRFPHDFIFGKRLKLAFVLRVSAPAFRLGFLGHELTYISLGKPWEEVVKELNELKPNAISAPPSFLLHVARSYLSGEITFKPTILISYAESLYSEVKEFLKKTFSLEYVYEIYKATEGAMATSCKYGRLHWNEDLMAVELFNKEGEPISFNEPSYRMVVTNLYKTATPLIRYELNDIIEFSDEKCPCGSNFRVVKGIQGRADDLLIGVSLDNTKHFEYLYPDYFQRAINTFNHDIIDYQIIQKNLYQFEIRIDTDKTFSTENLVISLEKIFDRYKCKVPEIHILHEKPLPHPKSLKLRRIIRDFTLDKYFTNTAT